jgi:Zn-dependent metalloprotease
MSKTPTYLFVIPIIKMYFYQKINYSMKKNISSAILLFLTITTFAAKHNHTDENEVRYYNANPLDVTLQQQLRKGQAWQSFLNTNPNWFVIFNQNNRMPHRAFGEPILLSGSSQSDVLGFLSATNFILPTDLRLVNNSKNERYINLDFNQFYNNIEVIDSRVYAKLSLDNKLLAFGLDVFNDINVSTIASISESLAITAAQQQINNPITDVFVSDNLKILPIPVSGKFEYHLVYTINFKTKIEEGPAHYTCYVDANDGALLMRKNEVMYEAPPAISSVSGDLYTTNPYNPSSVEKLKYLKANNPATNTNYYTDVNGDVNIPLTIGTQIRYKLEGLYADVQTNGNTPDIYQTLGSSNAINFDNSNSTIQERTAYWAVNEVHDHLKNIFPTFTGLDSPMETNVDEAGSCNAYFNGSSINFYEEGLSSNGTDYCEATGKIADVVYHEYGHAINSSRYNNGSGMWNGALNEGFADVWAFTITQDPILGIGFYQNNPSGFVRRFDVNKKVYPQDLVGEVHADGEIIAGAFWDTYLNLGDMQQTINLFKYTYDSNVDGADGNEGEIFTDILLEVLYADDNDGNLSNGTPNDNAIVSAFALHGITLISNAVINHNPVVSANANLTTSINANITLTYAWALGNVECHYRINSDTNWLPLAMTQSGNNYVAQIPGQVDGSIIAYYILLEDIYGMEAGITPFLANKSPIRFANLPYFILVGYDLKEEEDFDFSMSFWQTGDQNDNATTGLWAIGSPMGSFEGNTIVQTDAQHTQAGSDCAFTGNASSPSASIGENDIDGGHTTLYSPEYDLSSYVNPAFSYWRWFTNNAGAEPNADWWQVSITDDGVNWINIENSLTSDNSWRRYAFRAKDYVSLSSTQVQLKFVASDSTNGALSGGSLVEAALDDLYLWDAANSTGVSHFDFKANSSKLIRVTDLLGREVDPSKVIDKTTLFYIYDDGRVEKRIYIE